MNLFHARNIELANLRIVHERICHHGHQRHARGAFVLNQLQHVTRLEAAHHHLLGAVHCSGLRAAPAVGMKQRNRVQLHESIVLRDAARYRQSVQIESTMRQRDAFGRPGAAACIKQFRNFVFVERQKVRPLDPSSREQFFIRTIGRLRRAVDRYIALDAHAALAEYFDLRRELVFKHQHSRFGMVQNLHQLRRRQPHI